MLKKTAKTPNKTGKTRKTAAAVLEVATGKEQATAQATTPGVPGARGNNFAVEMWPIDRFQPYAHNPRRHDHVLHKLASTIREFGFKVPVLARSTGELIDGHFRLKAAASIGIAEIPVILCDEWSDAQVKAFRLLANKSSEWAEWDEVALAVELEELKSLDVNLDLIDLAGFDAAAKPPAAGTGKSHSAERPDEFREYDESIDAPHQCPKCGYQWS